MKYKTIILLSAVLFSAPTTHATGLNEQLVAGAIENSHGTFTSKCLAQALALQTHISYEKHREKKSDDIDAKIAQFKTILEAIRIPGERYTTQLLTRFLVEQHQMEPKRATEINSYKLEVNKILAILQNQILTIAPREVVGSVAQLCDNLLSMLVTDKEYTLLHTILNDVNKELDEQTQDVLNGTEPTAQKPIMNSTLIAKLIASITIGMEEKKGTENTMITALYILKLIENYGSAAMQEVEKDSLKLLDIILSGILGSSGAILALIALALGMHYGGHSFAKFTECTSLFQCNTTAPYSAPTTSAPVGTTSAPVTTTAAPTTYGLKLAQINSTAVSSFGPSFATSFTALDSLTGTNVGAIYMTGSILYQYSTMLYGGASTNLPFTTNSGLIQFALANFTNSATFFPIVTNSNSWIEINGDSNTMYALMPGNVIVTSINSCPTFPLAKCTVGFPQCVSGTPKCLDGTSGAVINSITPTCPTPGYSACGAGTLADCLGGSNGPVGCNTQLVTDAGICIKYYTGISNITYCGQILAMYKSNGH